MPLIRCYGYRYLVTACHIRYCPYSVTSRIKLRVLTQSRLRGWLWSCRRPPGRRRAAVLSVVTAQPSVVLLQGPCITAAILIVTRLRSFSYCRGRPGAVGASSLACRNSARTCHRYNPKGVYSFKTLRVGRRFGLLTKCI
jgi:hypothetical protein